MVKELLLKLDLLFLALLTRLLPILPPKAATAPPRVTTPAIRIMIMPPKTRSQNRTRTQTRRGQNRTRMQTRRMIMRRIWRTSPSGTGQPLTLACRKTPQSTSPRLRPLAKSRSSLA